MIAIPPGYTVVPGVERMTLVPPEGPQAGLIRDKERMRPLARLGEIVRQQLAACPEFVCGQRSAPERLVTHEGEHAAFIALSGQEDRQPAVRLLGVVFGDDFYALTSALCLRPTPQTQKEWVTLVRALVVGDSLGLGVRRRRRYEYEPPAGWQPLVSGFVTDWMPPDFPRAAAAITTFPAVPRQQSPAELFGLWLSQMESLGGVVAQRHPEVRFTARGGLSGQHLAAVVTGARLPLQRHLIVLEDATFTYALALKVDGPEVGPYLAEFRKVAGSIEAVPGGTPPVHGLVRHWLH